MIDPSILLQSQPVNIQTPLAAQTQVAQLGNLQGANALQGAQLTGANLDNQVKQQQLNDTQAIRRAYLESNGDLDATQQLALKYGASPQAMMSLRSAALDMRTKMATYTKDQLANMQATNDQLGGLMQPVVAETDPAKQQALWNQQLQQAVQKGLMAPQDAQQHPYPGRDGVTTYANSLKTNDQLIKEQTAAAQAAEAAAKGKEADTNADKFNLSSTATSLAATGNDADYQAALGNVPKKYADRFPKSYDRTAILEVGGTPGEALTATTAATKQAEEIRHNQQDERLRAQTNSIEGGRLQLERIVAGVGPDGKPITTGSPLADAIYAGKIAPDTANDYIRRQPGLLNQIVAAHPDFDETKIEARYAFNKRLTDYGPTEIGGQTLALNKLVHHSDVLYQMIDNLQNRSFGPQNAVYNAVATTFGKAPEGDFNVVRDFVVHESAKLAQGGAPNEADIKQEVENLKSSKSPDQLKSHLDKIMQIAGGSMQAINAEGQKYGMGQNFSVLDPENAPILQKHGFNATTLAPNPPAAVPSSPQPSQSSGAQTRPLTDPALAQSYLHIAGGDKNKARQMAARDGWRF